MKLFYWVTFLVVCVGQHFNAQAASVDLMWDAPSDMTGVNKYVVSYGTTSGTYTKSVQVPASRTSLTISGLSVLRDYYFVVKSLNTTDNIESVPSEEVFVTFRTPQEITTSISFIPPSASSPVVAPSQSSLASSASSPTSVQASSTTTSVAKTKDGVTEKNKASEVQKAPDSQLGASPTTQSYPYGAFSVAWMYNANHTFQVEMTMDFIAWSVLNAAVTSTTGRYEYVYPLTAPIGPNLPKAFFRSRFVK